MSDPAVPTAAVELDAVDVPAQGDPNIAAVRNIQWRVGIGECWVVGGPPGSGKSSAMSVAAGLVRPLRGRHRLFGRDVAALTEADFADLRSRVGMVFGGGGRLFPSLNVVRNLALPLLYHGRARGAAGDVAGRVESMLDTLGLTKYADRLPRELPRRIAERVALARALVLSPEVLILDDPISGLPDREAPWWLEMTRRRSWTHRPPTLVIACLDPRPWKDVAERFACVNNRSWQIIDSMEALCERVIPEEVT